MSHIVVGHCPHCGSPVYAPFGWTSVTPPPSTPSCMCRFSAGTAVKTNAEWKRGSATVNGRLLARIAELEAENARLNMEMAAYRQGCTPKDAAAMLSVIDALEAEKAARMAQSTSEVKHD